MVIEVFLRSITSYKNNERHIGNINPVNEMATFLSNIAKLDVSKQGKKYTKDLIGALYNNKQDDLNRIKAIAFDLFVIICQITIRMKVLNKASLAIR
ncbi:hypothetical protein GINT2_001008 [Glugoides intestinalis]